MTRLLALLVLAGCSVLPPGQATSHLGQATAVATVWQVYGRTDTPPEVLWVEPADLHCTDPTSGYPGFRWAGACMEGLCLTPDRVFVAFRPGESFSSMALAHEFWHAALIREGRLDPFHEGAGWGPGGAVEQAKWELLGAGL